MSLNSPVMLTIFIAVTAAAVLLQALVLLAIYFAMRQFQRRVVEVVENIRQDISPLLRSAHALSESALAMVRQNESKVGTITENLLIASRYFRDQASEANVALTEVIGRARNQAQRVDGMVTEVLNAVGNGTRLVRSSILLPLRQVGGWLHAARAALETLRRPEYRPRETNRDV